jgi:phosphatidyl-myo-inositol alpha-mannosyltransferase
MRDAPKLKIGLVLDTSLDPTDGVQQYVVTIGEWLRRAGHDVHYLAGQTEQRQLPNIHSLARNISVSFNGNRTTIPLYASRRKLRRFIQLQNFDVLHVQTPHHPLLAQRLVLAAGPRTAVVGTFHVLPYGWLSAIGNRLLGWWLRPSLRRFDAMLAVSDAAAAFCRRSFGLSTTVLPNVIDSRQFRVAKPLPQYAGETLTVLFLGRLVPRKGCLLLLEAVQRLQDRPKLPKFRVVICGQGPLEPQLRQFIAEHGFQSSVEMAGFVSEANKPRYYASADIAVFPSRGGESFGIVLLEAMAGGRSVVLGGDNPGYHSVLASRPELLFDTGSAAPLTEKLAYYLTHASERRHEQAWASRYAKQFDVSVIGGRLLDIYYDALHKRRGA